MVVLRLSDRVKGRGSLAVQGAVRIAEECGSDCFYISNFDRICKIPAYPI